MIRFLAAFFAIAMAAVPVSATTLIDNVEGISIHRDGSVDRFAAMVIDNEGRVVELLDFGDKPTVKVDYREDGRGRVVMPGFIDSHVKLMDLGLAQLSLDLTGTTSLDDALARIAAYAARHPDRPWVVGFGWDQEAWGTEGLGRFPTAAELDAVVPNRPVWLTRIDGHAGWANSRALTAANITADTKEPVGGRIIRAAGGKAPAGVVIGTASALVEAALPPPLAEDRDLALHLAQELLFAHGVTAVADMGTTIEDWMSYRRAGDAGRLRLRIMSYAASVDEMLLIGGTGPTRWLYADRLRMGGLELVLDGTFGSRGAMLKADYADEPGNRGLPRISGTQLRNLMSRAALDNFQVAIHAAGDAANEEALLAIDELAGDYSGDRRWRIEHAQMVDPADMALFAKHDIVASMQPLRDVSDRPIVEARVGASRLAGANGWASIAGSGATLAFGSDAPTATPAPLAGIAAALGRADTSDEAAGGQMDGQAISREAALAAWTANAAWAGFAEGHFGTLVPGEFADFVVLDADPLSATPEALRQISVVETWVAGQRVHAIKQ